MADYTETFAKADGSGWGPDLTWTNMTGLGLSTVSNEAAVTSTAAVVVGRADADTDGNDQYVEADITTLTGTYSYVGAALWVDPGSGSSARTAYDFRREADGGWALIRMVGGSTDDTFASGTQTLSLPETIRMTIAVDGSGDPVLTAYIDGVQVAQATDTSASALTPTLNGGMTGIISSGASWRVDTFRVGDFAAASGQTISLGRATETDTARAVTVVNPRTYTLGRATETDVARALTVDQDNPQTIVLGRATETDTARSLTVDNPRSYTLGRATESDTARSVTVDNPRTYVLGRATETNVARSVTVTSANVVTLGRATETDAARSLSILNPRTIQLGRATEGDTARALTVDNPRTYELGRATETDVARSLTATITTPSNYKIDPVALALHGIISTRYVASE